MQPRRTHRGLLLLASSSFVVACGGSAPPPASGGASGASPTGSSSTTSSTAPAPSGQGTGGSTAAEPTTQSGPFVLQDDDLKVTVDLPQTSTCVAFTAIGTQGKKCDMPPGARGNDFEKSGGLTILLSKGTPGPVLFTAAVDDKLHDLTQPDAFAQGIIDKAKISHGFTLVKDAKKSGTALVAQGTVVHRMVFDADLPADASPPQKAFSHWTVLAVPAHRGVYTFSWVTNSARANEADQSAEHALASVQRQAAK